MYPRLKVSEVNRIKEQLDLLQERFGAKRETTVKPGFTLDISSMGEAHKHPVYQIDHEGHIRISVCSAHGTTISAARPSTGVLVEFVLRSDGELSVSWGVGHQDLSAAAEIPAWLIRELDWALS